MALLKKLNFQNKAAQTLIGITRGLLALVLLVVPVLFIPGLNDPVELPKSSVFLFLTMLAAVFWMGSWMVSGEVRFKNIPGAKLLFGFVVIVMLSAIFSIGHVYSLLGVSGYVHHAFPILLGVVVFVIVLTQVLETERDLAFFRSVLVFSLGLAGLLNLLAIARIFPITQLPAPFLVTGNSAATAALLSAALVPIAMLTFPIFRTTLWKVLGVATLLISLLGLVVVDSAAGWIAVLVGTIVSAVLLSLRRLTRLEVVFFTVVMVVAVAGLLLPVNEWLGSRISPDLRLDPKTSWEVVKATLAEFPVIGSGPTTFFYDFVAFRPDSFAASPLSALRFVKASDEALQLLATLGVLGAASLLSLVVFLLFRVARQGESLLKRFRTEWGTFAGLFGSWAALAAGLFFIPSTAASFLLFWMLLALLFGAVRQREPERVVSGVVSRLSSNLAFFLGIILLVFITVWSVRLIGADRGVLNIASALEKTEDLERVTQRIDRVIRLNPAASLGYLLRAQNLTVRAQLLAQNQSPDVFSIQNLLQRAAADAETAVARDSRNPAVLEAVAEVYKNIGAVTGDTGDQVIFSYERAFALDDNNPSLLLNLGQSYYLKASVFKEKNQDQTEVPALTSKARSAFERVLELQGSNVDAGFGLVLVDELAGEKDQAFSRLESLTSANPSSAALWFELGMRLKDRDKAKAKNAFAAASRLQPEVAAPHLQLGLIAAEEKDLTIARTELELALKLDPGNEEARKKLEELK